MILYSLDEAQVDLKRSSKFKNKEYLSTIDVYNPSIPV
jgi:hypothetical protein